MAVVVKKRQDGQWEVSEESNDEPILSFEAQEHALEFAISIAASHLSDVVVYLPYSEFWGTRPN